MNRMKSRVAVAAAPLAALALFLTRLLPTRAVGQPSGEGAGR